MDLDDSKTMLLALGATAIAGFAALAYATTSSPPSEEIKPPKRRSKRSSKRRELAEQNQTAVVERAAETSSNSVSAVNQVRSTSSKKKRKHKGKKKRKTASASTDAVTKQVDAEDLYGTYQDDGKNPDSWEKVTTKDKPKTLSNLQTTRKGDAAATVISDSSSFKMELGNKVSLVIGKGGKKIMSIQDDTGANLSINKSTSELTITGTDAQIDLAKEAVFDALQGPASSNKTRGACSATMDVGKMAGAIIGRGGVTIKQIEGDSGASLEINRTEDSDLASVTISADDEESVEKAKQMIADILSGNGNGTAASSVDLGNRNNCFAIIGKGGQNIRELEQKSGARLSVDKTNFTVEIVGNEEQIKTARVLVTSALAALANSSNTFNMPLAKDTVGRVIGSGGSTIREIQSKSGARLEIKRDGRESDDVSVDIVGTPEAIAQAVALVEDALKTSRRIALKEGETEQFVELGRAVGSVIGRGGANILKLQSETGAKLNINKGSTECRIYGDAEAVAKATAEVEAIVKRVKESDAKKAEQKAKIAASGHAVAEPSAEHFETEVSPAQDDAKEAENKAESDYGLPTEQW